MRSLAVRPFGRDTHDFAGCRRTAMRQKMFQYKSNILCIECAFALHQNFSFARLGRLDSRIFVAWRQKIAFWGKKLLLRRKNFSPQFLDRTNDFAASCPCVPFVIIDMGIPL